MSGLITEHSLIPLGILAASLLGSAHCVAMCGGLVLALAPTRGEKLAYHLGRLVSYASLGALSGALGSRLIPLSAATTLPWVTTVVLATGLILLGARRLSGRPLHFQWPAWLVPRFGRLWRHATGRARTLTGSFFGGLLSALLPCGWLYGFVAAASATGSAALGAAALALFWLGTVPALTLAPIIVQRMLGPLRAAAPRASGALLVTVGLLALGLRASPLVLRHPAATPAGDECPLHHSH